MRATLYTELATHAADSQDSDKVAFFAYVEQLADQHENPHVREMFLNLGQAAWLSRGNGKEIHAESMAMYDKCLSKLGTKI